MIFSSDASVMLMTSVGIFLCTGVHASEHTDKRWSLALHDQTGRRRLKHTPSICHWKGQTMPQGLGASPRG